MKKLFPLLSAFLCTMLCAFTGCSDSKAFTAKTYCSDKNTVRCVFFELNDRQVEIGVSEDSQIHIEYFDGEKEFLDIALCDNGELTVKLSFNKGWADFIGTKPSGEYRKVTALLPEGLTAVTVRTTNETIYADRLSADEISLSSNGGDVIADRVNAGKTLLLSSKNGNIAARLSAAGMIFPFSVSTKKAIAISPRKNRAATNPYR